LQPVYQVLAGMIMQRNNYAERANEKYLRISTDRIHEICRNHMPSGSGIDNGTRIDLQRSTPEKLVFQVNYHHMNDAGYYDGWTEHTVTVKASLFDKFTITVSGRNRNDIKSYIADLLYWALREQITYMAEAD